jgi:hypothetical protein
VTLSYNEFDASWIYGVQNLCIVCYVCDFYFLANGHRIYFIKRKAAIYNVASGGYTRINKKKKKAKEGKAQRSSKRASREAATAAASGRTGHVRQRNQQ